MAGILAFAALKDHAEKIFKYQQGKTIPYIKPLVGEDGVLQASEWTAVKNGICAALVVDWLAEKMGTTNSRGFLGFGRVDTGSRSYQGDSSSSSTHMTKNFDTALRVIPMQVDYVKHVDEQQLFKPAGLVPDITMTQEANSSKSNGGVLCSFKKDARPEIEIAATLKLLSGRLNKHTGAYVGVKVDRDGHAVGLFRSNGNHIYFFDPNVGIYKLHAIVPFFEAWESGYYARNRTLTMETTDKLTIFRR